MSIDTLKRIGWFLLLLLAQVIVLGRIHLFGVAMPLLYVYFILQFPSQHPRWAVLLWGFAMGLSVDCFFNTPGLAAASLTAMAAIQPYYLQLFVSKAFTEGLNPSLKTLGYQKYAYYSIPLVLLFCVLFFALEQFSFFNITRWLLCTICSAALTVVLIFTLEISKKG